MCHKKLLIQLNNGLKYYFNITKKTENYKSFSKKKYDFTLFYQNKKVNPNTEEKLLLNLKEELKDYYFQYLSNFIPEKFLIVIKLYGGNIDLEYLAKNFLLSQEWHGDIIFHYHNWNMLKYYNENAFVYLVPNSKEDFKKLFDKFWFSIFTEQGLNIFIIKEKFLPELLKKINMIDDEKFLNDLVFGIIKNQLNGFHFQIITTDEFYIDDKLFL